LRKVAQRAALVNFQRSDFLALLGTQHQYIGKAGQALSMCELGRPTQAWRTIAAHADRLGRLFLRHAPSDARRKAAVRTQCAALAVNPYAQALKKRAERYGPGLAPSFRRYLELDNIAGSFNSIVGLEALL
jgi:hypothetical protein